MFRAGLWRRGRAVAVALGLLAVSGLGAATCGAPIVAPRPRPVLPEGAMAEPATPVFAAAGPASAPAAPASSPAARVVFGPASAPAPLRAYWVGHATVLVAIGDRWIITDPNFSDRVGLFVKRKVTPGIDLDALPEVSWILVSHGHFDHLDKRSLKRLSASARVATPPGVARFVPRRRFQEVVPLADWKSVERDGLRITAVPVRHGDGRYAVDGPFRRNAHAGFVVEYRGVTLFFAGDTAYHDQYFKAIGQRFRIDVALIPIGPVGAAPTKRFLRGRHADPADGLRILADVGARWMIPIHHGTFFSGGQRELDALAAAVRASPVGDRVKLLKPGDVFTLPAGAATGARGAAEAGARGAAGAATARPAGAHQ